MPGSEQPTSETPTPPQAISDAFWAAAELGSGPIVLDRAECMQLLATQSVGRVAYATDAGARILPVNYILGADCVIFRTVPDGEIFRYALNSTCAFEIDETNEFFESGWSVVAVAPERRNLAEIGDEVAAARALRRSGSGCWASRPTTSRLLKVTKSMRAAAGFIGTNGL